MFKNLLNALQESLFLILGSAFITLIIGLPLGLFFAMTGPKQLLANKWIYGFLTAILKFLIKKG
jgi:ABC-type methionine transport system permease subunit